MSDLKRFGSAVPSVQERSIAGEKISAISRGVRIGESGP